MRGLTLIEMLVVLMILGLLAVVAIPKYVDFSGTAKITATQEALAAIRTTLAAKYYQNASSGQSPFPSSFSASDFANNKLPVNKLTGMAGVAVVSQKPSGTAISTSNGFWYIQATGETGAYSDGTVDTSPW